ncbi:hypothetical protein, partial [Streptomyces beihaiensis]
SARDDLADGLGRAVADGGDWIGWLDGQGDQGAGGYGAGSGVYAAASRLAAANDADVVAGPDPTRAGGFPGYRVEVRSRRTVGHTIIPGTENRRATAHATAVIRPRCAVPADADPKKAVHVTCDGQGFDIDPRHFHAGDLPDAAALFSVRLAE